MTIVFSSRLTRAALSCCALCAAGLPVLAPLPATARPGTGPVPPPLPVTRDATAPDPLPLPLPVGRDPRLLVVPSRRTPSSGQGNGPAGTAGTPGAAAAAPSPARASSRTSSPVSPSPAGPSSAGASPTVSASSGDPRPSRSSQTSRPSQTSQNSRNSLLNRPGVQVRRRPGAPAVPDLSARSWLVADAGSGEVLAAYGAHRKLPPASTLKTLFAVTVLPTLPGGIQHRVVEKDLAGMGEGSSVVGVEAGRSYRVDDLWRGVFLRSGNDAVHVLAALDGGWRVTAARMQEKARALGARDTHVVSPDGYDTPGQVSSAFDLAVFGRAGLRIPEFARYCGTASASFPGEKGTEEIVNTNRLLSGVNGVPRYPGLIGIKNGYTSKAGNTLVAAARRKGRTLIVTVMNPQGDGGSVYEEARTLLDWGFAAAGRVDPVGSLDEGLGGTQGGARSPAGTAGEGPRPGPSGASVVRAQVAPVAGTEPGLGTAAAIAGAGVLGGVAVALLLRLKPVRRLWV